MKNNKFKTIGINAFFDTYDKSRFYGEYAKFAVQGIGEVVGQILKLLSGGNPLITPTNPNEATSFYKMQNKNLKSFKSRLRLLGQNEFCVWATNELNNNNQFAYGFYSLIKNGNIQENESLDLLKQAICSSLKRNNFKQDYSKPSPNDYKEFVPSNHYNDEAIIRELTDNTIRPRFK